MVVDDTVWQGIRERPEFKRRKEVDRESYIWDKLIEELSDPKTEPISGPGLTLTELELALRTMSREPRLSRRMLGRGVREFLEEAKAGKTALAHPNCAGRDHIRLRVLPRRQRSQVVGF